jgi:hypothetical protein
MKKLIILLVLALGLAGCQSPEAFKRPCKVMPLGNGQLGAGDEWAVIMYYDIETGKIPSK